MSMVLTGRPAQAARISHRFNPAALVALLVTVALALLVLQPVGWIVLNGWRDDLTGDWSIVNYARIFSSPGLIEPMLNSLILAGSTAILATLLGVPMAWLVARTDMPGRGAVRVLVLAAFITPSFIGALGWILLAAPNSGWLNQWLRPLLGGESPLNIYSMWGAVFVCAVYTVPFTFTIAATALDEMAVELEDASAMLGGGILRTMRTITLPLVMPAIVVGFILSFIQGMTLFGVPAFLLTPARVPVVTTKLAEFYQTFPPELNLAAAYCMPMLLMTGALFYLRKRILGRRQYVMIGGKARGSRLVGLGKWRWPALAAAMIVPLVTVFLPYAALALVSLSKAWGQGPSWDNLTLHWYRWAVLDNPQTQSAIVNSLSYATVAATFCLLLGVVVAYMVERRLFRGASLLGATATLPIIIPGIVLSVGYFSAFTQPIYGLYGSGALLVLAFIATFLPIAYSHGGSIIKTISPDLERASRILGAGEVRTFSSITLPLMKPGLVSGWMLIFIPVMRELSVAVFLITPQTNVMTTLIYNYKDGGNYEAVCATSIVLLVGTMFIVLLGRVLSNLARRRRAAPVSLGVGS
ncbi:MULTISPECIES: ABC transporter permease [Achromobacter]|uniref:Iron ABC transporter permease n=1 Tax=Achromobacter spanius TaxID=217203 RepID=A0ABY8GLD3_9BURK|nr:MULTISPECIES: iron ABC transporter permease [Achromobacter]WAI85094.1 iron ABC transporter permease [Achromobacter spanius]WEX95176.1 iron ABC transporter permease [Achromobacter sp. SS2-2022]WFP05653.1 iron ABC transporter permease [Achromobacter spanius]